MLKIFSTILLLIAASTLSRGQETVQLANYMNNQLVYNPAAAGMHETQFNANVLMRLQWTSFEGAPVNHMFWTDYRFPKNKMAVGLNVNHSSYGAYKNTEFLANYAYMLDISRKTKLSMGLRGGMAMFRYDASALKNVWDDNDLLFPDGSDFNAILPKVGFGLQLNSEKYYAGISSPDLLVLDNDDVLGNKDRSFLEKRRNYVMAAGYKWKLSNSYGLFPNVMVAYYTFSGWRADITMIGEITDYFWAGVTYSTSNNHALMAGTHISSRIRFSYAYQFRTGSGTSVLLSSHELNLLINLHGIVKKKK